MIEKLFSARLQLAKPVVSKCALTSIDVLADGVNGISDISSVVLLLLVAIVALDAVTAVPPTGPNVITTLREEVWLHPVTQRDILSMIPGVVGVRCIITDAEVSCIGVPAILPDKICLEYVAISKSPIRKDLCC